jgi:hypothetical protein
MNLIIKLSGNFWLDIQTKPDAEKDITPNHKAIVSNFLEEKLILNQAVS